MNTSYVTVPDAVGASPTSWSVNESKVDGRYVVKHSFVESVWVDPLYCGLLASGVYSARQQYLPTVVVLVVASEVAVAACVGGEVGESVFVAPTFVVDNRERNGIGRAIIEDRKECVDRGELLQPLVSGLQYLIDIGLLRDGLAQLVERSQLTTVALSSFQELLVVDGSREDARAAHGLPVDVLRRQTAEGRGQGALSLTLYMDVHVKRAITLGFPEYRGSERDEQHCGNAEQRSFE